MVLEYQINDAARSLDQQQTLDLLNGWYVVDPGGGSNQVTAGTGSFEYDAAAGDISAGGTIVTCSLETVDFATDIDANNDKIAVIYRDNTGTLQKNVGAAGTRDPSGDDVRSTHTPAPPSMYNVSGVVLAEVLLPAGASSIGAAELRDRRNSKTSTKTVLDEGTVTLSGGSTPALDTTLLDVFTAQTEDYSFALYVDADPAFNADYAFNYDYSHAWDDSDSAIDIDLTVNWDTDPGAGDDVTARWEVFA